MWRYLAGGGAILAAAGAGVLMFGGPAKSVAMLPAQPVQEVVVASQMTEDRVPEASPATREQKRFGRYDKDRDGKVTRDEYLAARRKAFAKLDVNGDGRLDFDEWAVKATTKFAAADRDTSGAMTAAEFATTAVKRKPASRPKCPPSTPRAEDEG